MLDLIKRHKSKIIYYAVLLLLLIFFVPNQEDYYLKSDIDNFKKDYFWRVMIAIILIISFSLLTKFAFKKKSLKENLQKTTAILLFSVFVSFCFNSIILASILYLNRMKTEEKTSEFYKVMYNDNKTLVAFNENTN